MNLRMVITGRFAETTLEPDDYAIWPLNRDEKGDFLLGFFRQKDGEEFPLYYQYEIDFHQTLAMPYQDSYGVEAFLRGLARLHDLELVTGEITKDGKKKVLFRFFR